MCLIKQRSELWHVSAAEAVSQRDLYSEFIFIKALSKW